MLSCALILSLESNISNNFNQIHPLFEFFDDFSCLGEELTSYSFVYISIGSSFLNVHLNLLSVQSMCEYVYLIIIHLITSDIWKNLHFGHEL